MPKTLHRTYIVYEPHEIPKGEFAADFIHVVDHNREEQDLYSPLCQFQFDTGRLARVYVPDDMDYDCGTYYSRWDPDDEVLYECKYWDKDGPKEGEKEERRHLRLIFAAALAFEQWDLPSPL